MGANGTNNLVGFLRHYGPIAASDNMYDELIQTELDHYGVKPPIDIPPARLDDLKEIFASTEPVSVILTGTAGDGKTFHCRRIWESFGGAKADWQRGDKVARLRLRISGRELVIVKDLSELTRSEKVELLPGATSALLGEDDARVYLIAANDGQLLATWREWAEAEGGPAMEAFKRLESMLVDGHEEDPAGRLRLRLYNLSRLDPSADFEALLERVVEHRMWADCEGCSLLQDDGRTTCPIRINRERLRGGADRNPFRQRLRQLLRLAAANRLHLPIRHLLLLVANIILGDGKPPTYLLTCRSAKNRAEKREYAVTNPYANVFGSNLPESQRQQYQVFTVLDTFGIGRETDNVFDNLLIYGAYGDGERDARMVGDDPQYGAAAYERLLHDYLEGERTLIREFARALENQRRRLFFSLQGSRPEPDPWGLTVYRWGDTFLSFCDRLAAEQDPGRITEDLVRGLNRTCCGMMIDDTTTVYLASSGGDGRGQIASVLNYELAVKPSPRDVYLTFRMSPRAVAPEVVVIDPVPGAAGREETLGRLELQPTHFEYLMRVAHGSLPASFSQQCYEDFLDFKLLLIDRLGHILGGPGENDPEVEFRAITVDASGRPRVEEFRIPVDA